MEHELEYESYHKDEDTGFVLVHEQDTKGMHRLVVNRGFHVSPVEGCWIAYEGIAEIAVSHNGLAHHFAAMTDYHNEGGEVWAVRDLPKS